MTSDPALPLLIVGARGRVGRLLVPAFDALGVAVALSHRGPEAARGTLIWNPLEGAAALEAFVAAQGKPLAMLVLAGSTPATGADMAVNISVARACVEAARHVGIGRVLLASSSAVYGRGRAEPWHEDDAVAPPSAYGQAKLEMEETCTGRGVCALRVGNVAGADALLTNTVLTNSGRPLVIDQFEDGRGPMRSYIGPQSLARVVLALAQTPDPLPPVLNIGTPTPVDMADLARAADLPFIWRPAPASATARLTLDTGRLETLVRFTDREQTAPDMIAQWRACQTQPGKPK